MYKQKDLNLFEFTIREIHGKCGLSVLHFCLFFKCLSNPEKMWLLMSQALQQQWISLNSPLHWEAFEFDFPAYLGAI